MGCATSNMKPYVPTLIKATTQDQDIVNVNTIQKSSKENDANKQETDKVESRVVDETPLEGTLINKHTFTSQTESVLATTLTTEVHDDKKNDFMTSIHNFVESHKDPNSFVNQVHTMFNVDKQEYNKQLQTFESDMKLFSEGKMDYATMRSLYG